MDGSSVARDIDIQNIDGIGLGSFAQVGLVKNSKYVVKIASNYAHEHHDRERAVYERLGSHPNILRFYGEVCIRSSERTLRGLLLEYHSAGTLDKVLMSRDFMSSRSGWPKQVVEAIRHVHSRGVVHGDVGCHNILVKSDGTLVLADFGGSRIDGSECLEFPPARYSRPKTAHDRLEPTEKDDIFALGTALYEISTSQLLYQDLDDGHIKARFMEQDYPNIEVVPPALQQIIVRCWSEKYTSADEVARDLEGLEASSSRLPCGISLVALGLFSATLVAILAVNTRRLGFHKVLRTIDTLRPWGLRPW
ncbi:hypothetical protein VTK56DRAFT_5918 [Thermocarpiscus australiensis]